MHAERLAGPEHAPSGRAGTGLEGVDALALEVEAGDPGMHRVVLPVPGGVVAPGDELRYLVFPEGGADEPVDGSWWSGGFSATSAAVDILFADGTRVSEAGVADQHGIPASAEGRGESRAVFIDQWNLVRIPLGRWVGQEFVALEAVLVSPAGDAARAWLDGVGIAPAPAPPGEGADLVDTCRGTHSTPAFSRGHTVPAAAFPHGFQLVLPVTDASERWRPFSYHAHHDEQNRLGIEALSSSHTATPWLGDYGIIHVLPVPAGSGLGRAERRRTTDHRRLVTRPHRIAAEFDDGGTVELAPTTHGFTMRATGAGHVVFDQLDDTGSVAVHVADGVATVEGVAGYVHELAQGAPPTYFAARVTHATAARTTEIDDRRSVGAVVDVAGDSQVTLATSLLSPEAARNRLDEAAPTVEEAATAAKAAWDELIGRVRPEGATPEQLATVAASLYRLFLYPSRMDEEGPDGPVHRVVHGPREGELAEGPFTVNNGFWDTYRTAWPAYALFDRGHAADLLDGVTQHARDSGWIPRWTAPSPVDCMVGTSSDVVYADAVARGVELADPWAGFDAAVRNATVASRHPAVGRKGLERGAFLGYIPADVPEGLSWTLENAVNDWALAQWARRLALPLPAADPRRRPTLELADYLDGRAGNAALLFDRESGFFRGRKADGAWSQESFDPMDWGGDFTETSGWGMAFTMPHDGRTLAWLHGGREALGAKLDEAFATDTAHLTQHVGGYGVVIHEMTEARAIRNGQVALSNQPAHHTPFMYAFSDRPWRTQAVTRDVLRRLFVGGDLGQGWPGDEDNGEVSAWYLFAAVGLYPLIVGAPGFVLTAPLFDAIEVDVSDGATLRVVARGNEPGHDYLQSVHIDGEPWRSTWVPHSVVAAGPLIEVELGPEPSDWFVEGPPSRSEEAEPVVLLDVSRGLWAASALTASFDSGPLFDDDASTGCEVPAGAVLEWAASDGWVAPSMLTLTVEDPASAPTAWRVSARRGGQWAVVDERADERFAWAGQTRAFGLACEGADAVRVEFLDGGRLAEVALLAQRPLSAAQGQGA